MKHGNVLRADTFFENVDSYMITLLKGEAEYQELKKKGRNCGRDTHLSTVCMIALKA